MTKKNIYYFIMIPFLVFHCLVLAFLVYRITTYYYCFLNSIDFCTTIILLTKYPNLEWAASDQVDALWFWRLNIKTCMVKVALKFKTQKNNQAIYIYNNMSFHFMALMAKVYVDLMKINFWETTAQFSRVAFLNI